jgi:arabinose-5-phosphate isomerase
MDLAADELAEGAVDHLVAGDAALADEGRRHHAGGEVGLVVGLDDHLGAGQAGTDQFCDFVRVHGLGTGRPGARDGWGGAVSCHLMDSPVHPTTRTADAAQLIAGGRRALGVEIRGLVALESRIDAAFAAACRLCLDCRGRVVVTGMGKSGHVGGKIAATLASTGTPAFFLHPAEASHGDLGMITRDDVLLALSNSGETPEILALLGPVARLGVPLLALTGNSASTLAREARVHLDVGVAEEACPLNLAPTASTTAALAMGDALAVALLEARGFTAEDFARSHPGGALGRRLLLRVGDVMRSGDAVPRVQPDTSVADGLLEMSRKGLGMTVVVDAAGAAIGVYTDGDLRRSLDQRLDIHGARMRDIMTHPCKTIGHGELAAEAVHLMEKYRITSLPVVDDAGLLVGALNVHDLLRSGVV